MVLFLFKTHNFLETWFYLRLQVVPIELGPNDRPSPYLRTPAPTQDRICINQAQRKPSARVKTNFKTRKKTPHTWGLAPMSYLSQMVCAVLGMYTLTCVGAGVLRQGPALSTGPNWVGSTWRRRQNPVSETLCVWNKNRTMDNIFLLINFITNNEEHFQTNAIVHSVNTRQNHYRHTPTANLSCFQKST
jgi:hypothetical protein